ncbi:hypothetical protein AB6A40_010878 [Gnathostoma spinigerum]|uniref:UDP-galactose transporter n=1 Tax=Gnathostoma spinigerum TaxID=75299 RepID=A0ABD6F2E2_9BILA
MLIFILLYVVEVLQNSYNSTFYADPFSVLFAFRFLNRCKAVIFDDYMETIKVCFPALIYTLQNNLYYIALGNLDATIYCLLNQGKVFVTAILMRLFLGHRLSAAQWFALLLLATGVAIVQLQYIHPMTDSKGNHNPFLGVSCVLTMCFTSGFAGVYMEKVLKKSTVSIYMQNIRLALLGIVISGFSIFVKDSAQFLNGTLLRGHDKTVLLMTFINAIGGILISITIKYANNILKSYAQSIAIFGTALGSWIIFDFKPNRAFLLGALCIIFSVLIYAHYRYKDDNTEVKTQIVPMKKPALRSVA